MSRDNDDGGKEPLIATMQRYALPVDRATAVWNAVGTGIQPILKGANAVIPPALRTRPHAPRLPRPPAPQPETPPDQIEAMLARLDKSKYDWVRLGTAERAELLRRCLKGALELAREVAGAGAAAKGSYESGLGDELAAFLPIVTGLYELEAAMVANGRPRPVEVYRRPSGQWVARVWPSNMIPIFFPNFIGEVWIQPGCEPTQGETYRRKAEGSPPHAGRVSLVLGAGNQVSVVAMDILHKLITCDEVVVAKMNPINDYLGPLLARAFAPLVERGYVQFAYGGAGVGKALVDHPVVEAIHLTGSADTYNAIVWGSRDAKRSGQPPLKKEVTAELGNVTPYVIVPGPWSDSDIAYHAANVAAGLAQNNGHNCLAAEIVVTSKDWPLREKFLDALRTALGSIYMRAPWYPGSEAKCKAFLSRFPDAERLGRPVPAEASAGAAAGMQPQPWLMAAGLSPDEAHTNDENWCGVVQEVALPGCGDAPAFLAAAVDFANKRCWGTLACSVFVHPQTMRDHSEAWDTALERLRYGNINVNCPAVAGYAATPLVWGAYPGNTPQDIGSGDSYVHNTYLFDHPEKSVCYAPWCYSPQPLWSLFQLGLERAIPPALLYIVNQGRPHVALMYLLVVAYYALCGSVPPRWPHPPSGKPGGA